MDRVLLDIRVNGESLELAENTAVRFLLKSSLFRSDVIESSYTMPFNIPISERNVRIFDYATRIEKKDFSPKSYDCVVIYDGIMYKIGFLVVRQTKLGDSFDCDLKIGAGYLSGIYSGKTLQDLDVRYRTSGPDEEFYPEKNYTQFPIYNESFYLGTPLEKPFKNNIFFINHYDAHNGEFPVKKELYGYPSTSWYNLTELYFFYLAYVIDIIFGQAGYQLKENVLFSDEELRRLVLYNNRSRESAIKTNADSPEPKDLLPDVAVGKFLNELRNMLGLGIFVDDRLRIASIKTLREIITSEEVEEWSEGVEKDSQEIYYEDEINGFTLEQVADGTDSYYTKAEIGLINDRLKSPAMANEAAKKHYEDTAQLNPPNDNIDTIGDIRLYVPDGLYYQMTGQEDTELGKWVFKYEKLGSTKLEYKSGFGEFDVKTEFSTMMMYRHWDMQASQKSRVQFTILLNHQAVLCKIRVFSYIHPDGHEWSVQSDDPDMVLDLMVNAINATGGYIAIREYDVISIIGVGISWSSGLNFSNLESGDGTLKVALTWPPQNIVEARVGINGKDFKGTGSTQLSIRDSIVSAINEKSEENGFRAVDYGEHYPSFFHIEQLLPGSGDLVVNYYYNLSKDNVTGDIKWGEMITPRCENKGIDPALRSLMGENDFGLRLLFYRGWQPDSFGNPYPMGSADVYNLNGKIEEANRSLYWDGEFGLYEKAWKEWLWWWINIRREVTFRKVMDINDLIKINFSKKYKVNGVAYLLQEVDVTLELRRIKVANVKAAKC